MMSDITLLMPEVLMAVGGMALMMLGAFSRGSGFKPACIGALALWAVVAVLVCRQTGAGPARPFGEMFILDGFASYVKILTLAGCAAALLAGMRELKSGIMGRFEYPVLMTFSALGMFLMVSANDLLTLYVGLELSSLALYVLAAFNRNDAASSEAGLKYFVLGAIASGLLLFGSSLIYGYTGSTQFDLIAATLAAAAMPGPTPVVVVFGMVLVLAAMTFKIAAAPFHMWTPDVYDGAPTPVTAFFAIAPKLAAIALLMRLVTGPFGALITDWQPIIIFMSVASMVIGAYAAIVQKSIKRLLAYSSIGNIGYALIGVATGTHFGMSAVLLYMTIYMVTTAGAFGIILLLHKNGQGITKIADLAGLSKTRPVLAYGMAVIMFSMSGIPPMAGFFGKLAVFQAAVASQMYVLAVIGVLTSVVAAWYYINIIRVMFFEAGDEGDSQVIMMPSWAGYGVVAASLIFVVGFVLVPGPLSAMTAAASAGLLP